MQIQLKQAEIVTALKGYIVRQGISLEGKDVQISFTAGRKESGISADISIEDIEVPFTEDEEPVAEAQVIPMRATTAPVDPTPKEEPTPEPAEANVSAETEAPKKTTSLFG